MARLDVRRLRLKSRTGLVLELQSDYMRDLPTVLVAPVISAKQLKPYALINPVITINGEKMAVRLEQIGGVSQTNLGEIVLKDAVPDDVLSTALRKLLFYV